MAQTKTKEELVRMAWLTELRRQGKRQCRGFNKNAAFESASKAKGCALQMLAFQLGISDDQLKRGGLSEVATLAGLSYVQAWSVFALNDGRGTGGKQYTFAEIADVVAGWFPS